MPDELYNSLFLMVKELERVGMGIPGHYSEPITNTLASSVGEARMEIERLRADLTAAQEDADRLAGAIREYFAVMDSRSFCIKQASAPTKLRAALAQYKQEKTKGAR